MKVYVEYAVIDNFVMDYLLLRLAVLGKSKNSSIKKRVLSALVGTVFAVYLPLFDLALVPSIALKILAAAVMVYFVCEYSSYKEYFIRLLLFFLYTAVFGGIIYGFCSVAGIYYDPLGNVFGGNVPLSVLLIAGAVIFLLCYKGYFAIFRRRQVLPFIRQCVLFSDGQKIDTVGFIDSGNSIMSGDECVCVASKSLAEKLFICGAAGGAKCMRKIPFKTAGGFAEMEIYSFDKLVVINGENKNIIYKVKIGIPENPIDFGADYSLILPAEFAGEQSR